MDLNQGAAIFAAILDLVVVFLLNLLEVSTPHPIDFPAFRAMAVRQFLFINGQVAVGATELFAPLHHKAESGMPARCHEW
jgi:hypothetical protein